MRLISLFSLFYLGMSQTFQSVNIPSSLQIEWDQGPLTFYTGQTLNVSWTGQNFLDTDRVKLTYPGSGGTRTLTNGVLFNSSSFAIRLSDSSNMVATNAGITATLATNSSVSITSSDLINVIQSKIINIVPMDGNRTLGGGQNTVCDDRIITVTWRGLGEAQFGNASVSVVKNGFGGGTLIPVSVFPASGNNTVNLVCSRSYNPSSFSTYSFLISVIESGGTAYTGNSATFNIATAPTPTSTSTQTPTPSKTPTPSPSNTPSPSVTPSGTPSPSVTPSSSRTPTSSQTPTQTSSITPAASVDYIAIGKAAASQVDTTSPAIIGAICGIIGVGIIIIGVKWYQSRQLTEKRMRRLAMTNTIVKDINTLYGHQVDMRGFTYANRDALRKGSRV